jgi:hypothetical protein
MEDLEDCNLNYNLTVRAFNKSGQELTQSDVHEVRLYIFGEDMRYLKSVDARVGESVLMEIPVDMNIIHVIGWGNLGRNSQNTGLDVGAPISDCFVNLLKNNETRASENVLIPDDLFRGEITLTRQQQQGGEVLLPLFREVGSVTVTVRGLKEYAGFDDDDYSIVVRGMYDRINFSGHLAGGETVYSPSGSFVMNGRTEEFYVPPFNMLPAVGISVDIYHGTQLIVSVFHQGEEELIACEKDALANVLIELKSSLEVSVSITDWGEEMLWKIF